MPSINMIAPRRAEKKRLERDMRRLVAVILVEMILAVGIGGWVCTNVLTTKAKVANLEVEITKLQPTVNKIKDLETETQKLQPKLDLLNQAKDSTLRWYNALDGLTQSMPSSTWLTRVATSASATDPAAGTVLNLNGVSSSQTKVGEIMMNLQANKELETVDLHFTQKIQIQNAQAVEFEIGAKMKAPEQPKQEQGVSQNGNGQS